MCRLARYLLVSDIPNDRIMRWDETTGAIGVFRHPAGYANGNTLDGEGRLVTCEHGNRRVTRTEHDGTITVLADNHDGDVSTAPTTSSSAPTGRCGSAIRRTASTAITRAIAPTVRSADATSIASIRSTVRAAIVADDFERPNGLAFSLDETQLYITDTRCSPHPTLRCR